MSGSDTGNGNGNDNDNDKSGHRADLERAAAAAPQRVISDT
jgi:hypothetical protein